MRTSHGIVLNALNRLEEAEKEFRRVIKLAPTNSNDELLVTKGEGLSIFHLGRTLMKGRQYEDAQNLVQSVISNLSDKAERSVWHYLKGVAQSATSDYEGAYESFRASLKIVNSRSDKNDATFLRGFKSLTAGIFKYVGRASEASEPFEHPQGPPGTYRTPRRGHHTV